MIKKRHLRLLAALMVVFYMVTTSHLPAIARASGASTEIPGAVESDQTGETPKTPEEPEDPDEPENPGEEPQDPGNPGNQGDEQPENQGEEPRDHDTPVGGNEPPGEGTDEEPDHQTPGADNEPEEPGEEPGTVTPQPDEQPDEEPGEELEEAGDEAPESDPATTSLRVRYVLVTLDGEEETIYEVVLDGLEIGTTVYGVDLIEDFGVHPFLYSTPEELVLGEGENLIELFYEEVENPDGLEAPEIVPAPPIPDVDLMESMRLMGGLALAGEGEGSLTLSKKAEQVPGTLNRWLITLTLSGKNREVTSDIVLVIDKSASMASGGRLSAAKTAAKEFVNTLLDGPESKTRIAVVSFSSSVTTYAGGFTGYSGKQSLINAIDNLSASGGTHTQAGIRAARNLLAQSTADRKVIVLLSDGEPTYSYRIQNVLQRLNSNYFSYDSVAGRYYSRDDLDPSVFTTSGNSAGDGTSMTTRIQGSYYYHHGHSAIAEARAAKNAGVTIYSIGLTPGTSGQNILNRIASDGKWYAATTQNLTAIFQDAAGRIISAARNAEVTDPIAEKFTIPADMVSQIWVSQGKATYNPTSKTITWEIGSISENEPASMTYTVEISKDAESGVLYETNNRTFVSYTDPYDNNVVQDFTVPEVSMTKMPLRIVANSTTVTYNGEWQSAQGFEVEGSLLAGHTLGDLAASAQGRDAGEYTVTFDCEPVILSGGSDVTYMYDIELVTGKLTILPKPASVTPNDKTKVYGDSDPVFDGELKGFLAKDNVTASYHRASGEDVGNYVINATLNPADALKNYDVTYNTGTLTITKRSITVKADDKTKVYGESDPALTYQVVDGELVAGDEFTGKLSRVEGEDVGTYAITQGTLTLSENYELTFIPGTFTIIKGEVPEPEVEDYEGIYDGEAHTITVVQETLLDGDTVYYSLSNEGPWDETPPKFTNVTDGAQFVYVKVTNKNYFDRYAGGTVTIYPRPVTVRADNKTKVYGQPDPALTYRVTEGSLVGEDQFTGALSREPGESVGTYQITQGTLALSENYELTFVPGTLTITPVPPEEPEEIEEEIPDEPPPLLNLADHFAYIQGYPDGTVRPEGYITREEVAAVFFRLLDPEYRELIRAYEAPFPDVAPDRWSAKHIATLAQGGILTGYPDGTFGPENYITRAELAVIASRFDELTPLDEDRFSDVKGHWAEQYINSAAAKGWVEGYPDGTFQPDNYITRAEFVTLVNRILNRKVRAENILPEAKQFPDLLPDSWYYEAMQEAVNSHLYEREEDDYEKWLEIYEPDIEM